MMASFKITFQFWCDKRPNYYLCICISFFILAITDVALAQKSAANNYTSNNQKFLQKYFPGKLQLDGRKSEKIPFTPSQRIGRDGWVGGGVESHLRPYQLLAPGSTNSKPTSPPSIIRSTTVRIASTSTSARTTRIKWRPVQKEWIEPLSFPIITSTTTAPTTTPTTAPITTRTTTTPISLPTLFPDRYKAAILGPPVNGLKRIRIKKGQQYVSRHYDHHNYPHPGYFVRITPPTRSTTEQPTNVEGEDDSEEEEEDEDEKRKETNKSKNKKKGNNKNQNTKKKNTKKNTKRRKTNSGSTSSSQNPSVSFLNEFTTVTLAPGVDFRNPIVQHLVMTYGNNLQNQIGDNKRRTPKRLNQHGGSLVPIGLMFTWTFWILVFITYYTSGGLQEKHVNRVITPAAAPDQPPPPIYVVRHPNRALLDNTNNYGPNDWSTIIQMIKLAHETYEVFDFNSIHCQKKALCEMAENAEWKGEVYSISIRLLEALQTQFSATLPKTFTDMVKEYKDALMDQNKECNTIYKQCKFSMGNMIQKFLRLRSSN